MKTMLEQQLEAQLQAHKVELDRITRENAKLRVALDESPWPHDVWPNTVEEAGTAMREALGDLKTTAISGVLMRHGWERAKARLAAI